MFLPVYLRSQYSEGSGLVYLRAGSINSIDAVADSSLWSWLVQLAKNIEYENCLVECYFSCLLKNAIAGHTIVAQQSVLSAALSTLCI